MKLGSLAKIMGILLNTDKRFGYRPETFGILNQFLLVDNSVFQLGREEWNGETFFELDIELGVINCQNSYFLRFVQLTSVFIRLLGRSEGNGIRYYWAMYFCWYSHRQVII